MVFAVLAIAACGGSDSSGPSQHSTFPDVAGVYDVHASFDDFTASEASASGTITLTQASREAAAIGASIDLVGNIDGDISHLTGASADATVSTGGSITFVIGSGGATWTFTATRSGNTFTGRHTVTDGTNSFSGAWTGVKTASAGIQASPDAAAAEHRDAAGMERIVGAFIHQLGHASRP
jgi:hypothetical protein